MEIIDIIRLVFEFAVLPFIAFMFHLYLKKTETMAEDKKKIVDLEMKLNNKEIKIEMDKMNSKIESSKQECSHRKEEIENILESFKKTFDVIFKKLDRIDCLLSERKI